MRNGSETRPAGQSGPAAFGAALGAGASADAAAGIGQLFRDLRRCLELPLPDLARRLETRMDVIQALEEGDVTRLPPWPETVRVVSAFTLLAGIDPRPVLQVIGERITAEAKARTAPPGRAVRQVPMRSEQAAKGEGRLGPAWGLLRARVSSLLPVQDGVGGLPRGRRLAGIAALAVVAIALLVGLAPMGLNQASATGGPGLLSGLTDYLLRRSAPERDGLRWIEVDDPRSRRANKLRSAGQ